MNRWNRPSYRLPTRARDKIGPDPASGSSSGIQHPAPASGSSSGIQHPAPASGIRHPAPASGIRHPAPVSGCGDRLQSDQGLSLLSWRYAVALISIFVCFTSPPAAARQRAAPKVIPISGPRVSLADLWPGAAALPEVDLGPAPTPGSRRRIFRYQIKTHLRGQMPSHLPAYWDVITSSQSLSCADLERQALAALEDQLPPGLTMMDFTCHSPLVLPRGEVAVKATFGSNGLRAGRVPVTLQVQAGQWPPRSVYSSVVIDGTVSVLVAVADLTAGSTLRPTDFRLEQQPVSTAPQDALHQPDELSGMRLTARLRTGTVLRRGQLAPIPLISKGSAVTIFVRLQGIKVSSRGMARSDGKRGETITVLCQASNRLLQARVEDQHLVVVDL